MIDRVGTFVDPEFQGRGIADALTGYSNKYTDNLGIPVFVNTVPSSLQLFKRHGFVEQGYLETDLEVYGGAKEIVRTTTCFRDALQSSN